MLVLGFLLNSKEMERNYDKFWKSVLKEPEKTSTVYRMLFHLTYEEIKTLCENPEQTIIVSGNKYQLFGDHDFLINVEIIGSDLTQPVKLNLQRIIDPPQN